MVSKTSQLKNNVDGYLDVDGHKLQISDRIRRAIRRSGGNAVVSEKSGVNLKTVSNYTRGHSEPKIISLSRIAKVCGVSIDWLATGEGPKHLGDAPDLLDMEVLKVSITIAEEIFEGKGFSPEDKAKIIIIIYEKGLEEKAKDC